jgi:hypothetical protein
LNSCTLQRAFCASAEPIGNFVQQQYVQLVMKVVGLVVLIAAATASCGSSPSATPVGDATVIRGAASTAVTVAAATTDGNEPVTSLSPVVPDTATGVPPQPPPDPDLGQFTDQASVIQALLSSGPLDNRLAETTEGSVLSHSICADIVQHNEPSAGKLDHEAIATLNGQTGVVLVLERADGGREVRMYGTGDADPVTGGCPLWFQAPL